MFEFAWPAIWLLAPLPLAIYWFSPPARQRGGSALRVPFYSRLAVYHTEADGTRPLLWAQKLLLVLIWLLCVGAAAKPQRVGEPISLPTSGRDLLLAVDISGSMETPDMVLQGRNLERLDVVKFVVSEFVERRVNDRLGLVLFGSQAYLQAPLTFDRTTVGKLLREAQIGFAGQQTAIGDAIGLSVKRLRSRPEGSRVLILLTDGANTAGELEPRVAAELAKAAGVKIYTIGVGADEMVERSFFGPRRINPSADLDEDTLIHIAQQTGGRYFRARDPQQLVEIYQDLDKYEPVEQDEYLYRPISALFFWPLAAALLLSFCLAALNLSAGAFRVRGTAVPTSVSKAASP